MRMIGCLGAATKGVVFLRYVAFLVAACLAIKPRLYAGFDGYRTARVFRACTTAGAELGHERKKRHNDVLRALVRKKKKYYTVVFHVMNYFEVLTKT